MISSFFNKEYLDIYNWEAVVGLIQNFNNITFKKLNNYNIIINILFLLVFGVTVQNPVLNFLYYNYD